MSKLRAFVFTFAIVTVLPAASQGPPKYQPGQPQDAEMRLLVKSDGVVVAVDKKDHKGYWQRVDLVHWGTSRPPYLGAKLVDIEMWAQDVTLKDLKADGGKFDHRHEGSPEDHPPFNSHCHGWYQIGADWYWYHC